MNPAPPDLTAEEVLAAERRIPAPPGARHPLTPGRMVYLLFHRPRAAWDERRRRRRYAREGQSAMNEAFLRWAVGPAPEPAGAPVELHYLTGRRYLPMTAWAALSARQSFGRPVRIVLHDDGTLGPDEEAQFARRFPGSRVVRTAETEAALDRLLPPGRFPFLRRIRLAYIHLRKLTDLHAHEPGRKIVSDSDVFFFGPPAGLLAAADAGRWCFMQDCAQSYGYPAELLQSLAGAPLFPKVNVGLLHLDGGALDWEFIEAATRVLLSRHGFSYYLEQALVAMLMARAGGEPLDAGYLVSPDEAEARDPRRTALHYVDRSLVLLYRHGWRQVAARSTGPTR